MDIGNVHLPLENLFDLLAFLSRPQLSQLASCIGNRRLATIVQTFLHKYVTQITLGPINISKGFSLADWPIPEHVKITNFKSIHLSYLDFSILRFLQIFQQNLLFTDINLNINTLHTPYNNNATKILAILCHLLPMLDSIDSLTLKGTHVIDEISKEISDETSEMLKKMMDKARVLEICTFHTDDLRDCLCRWLYTPPRNDQKRQKARVLLLSDAFMNYRAISLFLERIKRDFLMTNGAVSYFIGIQSHYSGLSNIPNVPVEILTNSRTRERMVSKRIHVPVNEPVFMLISRYPLDSAQGWIDESEDEILEWKRHQQKRNRTIQLEDGWHCDIGPMTMECPFPFPQQLNIFRRFISNLKRIWK